MTQRELTEIAQLLNAHRATAIALHRRLSEKGDVCLNCGASQDAETLWVMGRCVVCRALWEYSSAKRLSSLIHDRQAKTLSISDRPAAPSLDFTGGE